MRHLLVVITFTALMISGCTKYKAVECPVYDLNITMPSFKGLTIKNIGKAETVYSKQKVTKIIGNVKSGIKYLKAWVADDATLKKFEDNVKTLFYIIKAYEAGNEGTNEFNRENGYE